MVLFGWPDRIQPYSQFKDGFATIERHDRCLIVCSLLFPGAVDTELALFVCYIFLKGIPNSFKSDKHSASFCEVVTIEMSIPRI